MKSKRIVVPRHGGPELMRVIEEDLPEPGEGQVRVRILAVGIGFPDLLIREGTYPGSPKAPFTPGYDLVGVVDKRGPGSSLFTEGQRVAALTVWGSYTQFLCLPERELVAVPEGLDPAEAVSLVLNYVTAFQLLHRAARVKPGERVLVHGAAGGVGTALLQLGKLAELELYGTATGAKCETVARLGATPIDYQREDFVRRLQSLTGGGVDVVLDGIGGRVSWRSYRALRAGGRLVLFGHFATLVGGRKRLGKVLAFYAYAAATFLMNLIPDGRRVRTYRIALWKQRHPDWFREDLGTLFHLLSEGKVAPLVARRLPLVEARRAHELLGAGGVVGKLVLLCAEPA